MYATVTGKWSINCYTDHRLNKILVTANDCKPASFESILEMLEEKHHETKSKLPETATPEEEIDALSDELQRMGNEKLKEYCNRPISEKKLGSVSTETLLSYLAGAANEVAAQKPLILQSRFQK